MEWNIALYLAIAVLVLGLFAAYRTRKTKNKIVRPFTLIFGSVFMAILILTVPVYLNQFAGEALVGIKSILMSCYGTVKIFLVDGEMELMRELSSQSGWVYSIYTIMASVLYVVAPALTFSFVLSFFKNLAAYRHFMASRSKDIFIFSCLSERSVVLAKDIMKNGTDRAVIFCAVDDETDAKLKEKAEDIGAIIFKKEITSVNFKLRNSEKQLHFFAINENEAENVAAALDLIEKYKNEGNTHLHAFTTGISGELQLAAVNKGSMKVRRIDSTRSVINRILYDEGHKLFEGAKPMENGEKKITAVVVGLGSYGMGMVKSLAWYGQMYGYKIEINGFDKDKMAFDRLSVDCPELVDEKYNGVYVKGEGCYSINIHSEVNTGTKKFADRIKAIKDATYVLVALGNDEKNIETAAYLRMLFERNGAKPVIQAIVYDSEKKRALSDIKNYRGQSYNIDFIGDLEYIYSENVILDSELERDALERHLKWGKEQEFWDYEYNYRSSIATAIHFKARKECNIVGMNKTTDQLTTEERDALEALEHMRWNVYMRSEGYVFSGSQNKSSRNDLGKMHHDLVDFEKLDDATKRKDSNVGAK